MPEKISKTQRWLDLIAYLVGRRMPVSVDELMEAVPAYARSLDADERTRESTRRTFERDKDELRELGIPIESVKVTVNAREQHDAYRLSRADFYLPFLELVTGASPREPGPRPGRESRVELPRESAQIAMDALRSYADVPAFPYAREARSALRKLSLGMHPSPPSAPDAPALVVEAPGADEVSRTVRAVSEALLARKRISFRYHGIHRGEATDRDVAAYGLLLQHGHWYVVGHDYTREAIRVFRADRMETPRRNAASPKKPDYEIPAGFRLRDYLARNAWEIGDDGSALRALVLFRFPASLWAERNAYGELQEEHADGSAVRTFDVRQVDAFVRWLLYLEGDAVVLHPPELQRALADRADHVARLHGPGGQRGDI